MYQAPKNVLSGTIRYLVTLAIVAVSTLFAFTQPISKALASENKQGEVVAIDLIASNSALPFIESVLEQPKISTFTAKKDFLRSVKSVDYLLERKVKSSYASPKTEYVQAAVAIHPALKAEIKAEVAVEVTGLNADVLLELVNKHRVSIGLAELQKDESLMQLARERAPELFDEIFVNGNMHAGFHARANNLAYFATENIIYNHSEAGAFQWWINSPIHRSAIQNPAHTHTGIACSGLTCSQIFTHFQAK